MASLFGQAIWNASSLLASTQFSDEYPKLEKCYFTSNKFLSL